MDPHATWSLRTTHGAVRRAHQRGHRPTAGLWPCAVVRLRHVPCAHAARATLPPVRAPVGRCPSLSHPFAKTSWASRRSLCPLRPRPMAAATSSLYTFPWTHTSRHHNPLPRILARRAGIRAPAASRQPARCRRTPVPPPARFAPLIDVGEHARHPSHSPSTDGRPIAAGEAHHCRGPDCVFFNLPKVFSVNQGLLCNYKKFSRVRLVIVFLGLSWNFENSLKIVQKSENTNSILLVSWWRTLPFRDSIYRVFCVVFEIKIQTQFDEFLV
jgi:hypothetical protein